METTKKIKRVNPNKDFKFVLRVDGVNQEFSPLYNDVLLKFNDLVKQKQKVKRAVEKEVKKSGSVTPGSYNPTTYVIDKISSDKNTIIENKRFTII